MATKIFVGNFSFAVDDNALREYFATFGEVVYARVMTEGPGGRSRGFGFVEMVDSDCAKRAIEELDGKLWHGRPVKVSEDRNLRGQARTPHPGSPDSAPRTYGSNDNYNSNRENRFGSAGGAPGNNSYSGGGQIGYFRAQPLDIGVKKRKKADPFLEDKELFVDYKDPKTLIRFVSERGRILPRRMTGLTAQHQRLVTVAIKRAQHLAMLPYTRG